MRRSLTRTGAELASYSQTKSEMLRGNFVHFATFGAYTHPAKPDPANLEKVNNYRRAQYELDFLDQLANANAEPEVSYDSALIRQSVNDLRTDMSQVTSRSMRAKASAVLAQLKELSKDNELQDECSIAMASIGNENENRGDLVALKPSTLRHPALRPDALAKGAGSPK
ncbi:MAG: hypothetical protein M3Y72_25820 [Acidobacteriota bacterium]|nr:hypothetical protein [Acidobacteriota bacterium]